MTDQTPDALRASLRTDLPALQENNDRLRAAMQSLLSPAVVAALAAGTQATIDSAGAETAARDAATLLKHVDAGLPALRKAAV